MNVSENHENPQGEAKPGRFRRGFRFLFGADPKKLAYGEHYQPGALLKASLTELRQRADRSAQTRPDAPRTETERSQWLRRGRIQWVCGFVAVGLAPLCAIMAWRAVGVFATLNLATGALALLLVGALLMVAGGQLQLAATRAPDDSRAAGLLDYLWPW